jgi:hypothetical protein
LVVDRRLHPDRCLRALPVQFELRAGGFDGIIRVSFGRFFMFMALIHRPPCCGIDPPLRASVVPPVTL